MGGGPDVHVGWAGIHPVRVPGPRPLGKPAYERVSPWGPQGVSGLLVGRSVFGRLAPI